jgi:hypothetical protein
MVSESAFFYLALTLLVMIVNKLMMLAHRRIDRIRRSA